MTRTFTERVWCLLSNSGLCKTEIGTHGWTGGGLAELCMGCEERRAGRTLQELVIELIRDGRLEAIADEAVASLRLNKEVPSRTGFAKDKDAKDSVGENSWLDLSRLIEQAVAKVIDRLLERPDVFGGIMTDEDKTEVISDGVLQYLAGLRHRIVHHGKHHAGSRPENK